MTSGYLTHPLPRKKTVPVPIGSVVCGGDAPIVVQSMTNTDTADIEATVEQVAALATAQTGNPSAGKAVHTVHAAIRANRRKKTD